MAGWPRSGAMAELHGRGLPDSGGGKDNAADPIKEGSEMYSSAFSLALELVKLLTALALLAAAIRKTGSK